MATRSRGGVRQALEPEMNEPLKTGTILHSTLGDSETVDELFRLILGRSINNDDVDGPTQTASSAKTWSLARHQRGDRP
jgi:hypothetical protein